MRYTGFSPRAVLVRKYLGARPEDVVLEIGPGSGNTARAVIGRTAGYWGVDISAEAVRGLEEAYGGREDVVFGVADVCGDGFLGRTFDRIFSMDTLEHVADDQAFFRFAARHLVPGGTALICFPNAMREKRGRAHPAPDRHAELPREPETAGRSVSAESAGEKSDIGTAQRETSRVPNALGNDEGEARHGITWFETPGELEGAVRAAGFKIEEMLEIRDSAWQKFIRALLWECPRAMALGVLRRLRTVRTGMTAPPDQNTYEGTESFRINKRGGVVRDTAAVWARFVAGAARIFPPYRAHPAGKAILGRRILMRLCKPRVIESRLQVDSASGSLYSCFMKTGTATEDGSRHIKGNGRYNR